MSKRRRVLKRMRPDGTGFAVYRETHWDEWITEFYAHGKRLDGSDYHTDCRQDAEATGEFWLTGKSAAAETVYMETMEG